MRRILLSVLLVLAGCDNMIHQDKKEAYADESVGPGETPAHTVDYRSKPVVPPPVTLALLQRGQDRFRIFCTPCHSELGDGHGMIVQRGLPCPALLSHCPVAGGTGRAFLRRDDEWLRRDVLLRLPHRTRGPLGHCRLYSCPAAQPIDHGGGFDAGPAGVAAVNRADRYAVLCGLVGLLVAGIGWLFDATGFYGGWLAALTLLGAWPLGSMAALMTHSLTGGRWGEALRPALRLGVCTLPLLLPAVLPLAAGLPLLYPWARPDAAQHFGNIFYLNVPFFAGRAVAYLVVWFVLGWLVLRAGDLARIAPAGLFLLAVTTTFAAIDTTMSLDPHFTSSIYGMINAAGMGLLALSMAVLLTAGGTAEAVQADFGKLLLALVVLWAYLDFMQLLIIWQSNLAVEAPLVSRPLAWAVGSIAHRHRHRPFLPAFRAVAVAADAAPARGAGGGGRAPCGHGGFAELVDGAALAGPRTGLDRSCLPHGDRQHGRGLCPVGWPPQRGRRVWLSAPPIVPCRAARVEERDVSLRFILMLFAAIAASLLLLIGVAYLIFPAEIHDTRFAGPFPAFPDPQLQPSPAVDMQRFYAAEMQRLNSVGWQDRAAGTVHIPIAQAMALVARDGIPGWPTGSKTASQGARR